MSDRARPAKLPRVEAPADQEKVAKRRATGTYSMRSNRQQNHQQSECSSQRDGARRCESKPAASAKPCHKEPARLAVESRILRHGALRKEEATGPTRTGDLRFTKPLLYQLSYGGECSFRATIVADCAAVACLPIFSY